MKAVVKIEYPERFLKLATESGYEEIKMEIGKELDLELTEKRRCIGFHDEKGSMTPCPEFREIESGDQCSECRRNDIYTGWRQGKSSPGFEADYSVYLAQCGKKVKVGVTRSSRLESRWREQGADFAVELDSGLSGDEALERERELSEKGFRERVRKERKIEEADNRLLREKLDELGVDRKIEVVYGNSLACSVVEREGRFPSPIREVKGQIVSNGRIGLALTSGKVLRWQRQKGLDDF